MAWFRFTGNTLGGGLRNDLPACMDPNAYDYNPDATVEDPDNPCVYDVPYSLLCDSISASKSKCGTTGYGGSGKIYRRIVAEYFAVCGDSGGFEYSVDYDDTVTECDGETVPLGTCCAIYTGSPSFTGCSGGADEFTETTFSCFIDCFPSGPAHQERHRYTVSDEYSTALLISNTEVALPSYPATWNGTCSAFRDLSGDESSYSIRRTKYKFKFGGLNRAAGLQGGITLNWVERVFPSDGSAPTDTPRSLHISKAALIAAGTLYETPVYELLEPSVNGYLRIEDITCTAP